MTAAQTERDASRILKETWAKDWDPSILPIDPILISRSMGLKVYRSEMDDGVSGAIVSRSGSDPAIYINRGDSKNRQRFTCAHELGHYVQRTNNGDEDFEWVDKRDALSSRGMDPDEVFANQFAAALLMPEHLVRLLAPSLDRVDLAYRFGVSPDAMRFRLVNLDLL